MCADYGQRNACIHIEWHRERSKSGRSWRQRWEEENRRNENTWSVASQTKHTNHNISLLNMFVIQVDFNWLNIPSRCLSIFISTYSSIFPSSSSASSVFPCFLLCRFLFHSQLFTPSTHSFYRDWYWMKIGNGMQRHGNEAKNRNSKINTSREQQQ